jgi:hypothetical protein
LENGIAAAKSSGTMGRRKGGPIVDTVWFVDVKAKHTLPVSIRRFISERRIRK